MLAPIVLALVAAQGATLRPVDELPGRFESSLGEAKLVLVLSPGSGMGQKMARSVQREVLLSLVGKPVRTFVVWTPVMRGESMEEARKAANAFHSLYVEQFWDPGFRIARQYGSEVKLPNSRQLAWNCAFVHSSGAKWTSGPPEPSYWMHSFAQDDRRFDSEKLAAALLRALGDKAGLLPPNAVGKALP